ncbi:MAG: arginine--tRNA ligase [Defluviitaleaceae bacterium]|nr:arginine--tRNA ligase [Defluviitaleaceae bacterium]
MDYKTEFAKLLSSRLPESDPGDIARAVEIPQDAAHGHLAYPCFRHAKQLKKAPAQIASELAISLSEKKLPDWANKIMPAGAYVNVFLDRADFASRTIMKVLSEGSRFGGSDAGGGRLVLVEYSSPNIAKHFHVGHLGSTMIGNAINNIYKFIGYKTVSMNFLGDWGTQFGKLITAYLRWGDKDEIERDGLDGLTKLYVRFHAEADADKALEDEARAWVVRMQDGDTQGLSLWRWFYELSMKEFERIYKKLNVTFDVTLGESEYNDKMRAVADELSSKGLLKESDGAMIVDLEDYGMPPCLILRSDGGTLYPTRDIASAFDRRARYDFHKSLYVTANEQVLHFAQWMKVIELMGYDWAKDMAHIPYGLYIFETGKMSTRRGEVIKMDELLNEAVGKTLEIINEKNPGLENKEAVAEKVGVGAVIFNKLYNSRIKDVVFSWERMLNFDGETGPYVQYAHARACSVLEKADRAGGPDGAADFDGAYLTDDEAFEIARLLYSFPESVMEAAEKYEPFIVSRHLVAISQAFNKFYHSRTVLSDDPGERAARLALTKSVKTALRSGLALLGIEAPERM